MDAGGAFIDIHSASDTCRELPASFEFSDEIYEFKNWPRAGVHTLRSLQHHEDVFANDLYRSHLAGGIRWAVGLAAGDDAPGNPVR